MKKGMTCTVHRLHVLVQAIELNENLQQLVRRYNLLDLRERCEMVRINAKRCEKLRENLSGRAFSNFSAMCRSGSFLPFTAQNDQLCKLPTRLMTTPVGLRTSCMFLSVQMVQIDANRCKRSMLQCLFCGFLICEGHT